MQKTTEENEYQGKIEACREGGRRGGAAGTGESKRRTNQKANDSRMSAGRSNALTPSRLEEDRMLRRLVGPCTVFIRACNEFFEDRGMTVNLPCGGPSYSGPRAAK